MSDFNACLAGFKALSEKEKKAFFRNVRRSNPELLPTPEKHKKSPQQLAESLNFKEWSIKEQDLFFKTIMPDVKHLAYIGILEQASPYVCNLPENVRKGFASKLGFSQTTHKMRTNASIRMKFSNGIEKSVDVPMHICPIVSTLFATIENIHKCFYQLGTFKSNQDVILDFLKPALFTDEDGYNNYIIAKLEDFNMHLTNAVRAGRMTDEQYEQYRKRVAKKEANAASTRPD